MKNKNLVKGNQLEKAVEEIEKLIFNTNPALRESDFVIERNKSVIVDEVRHEIDLYVKIDSGNDYISIFIFECKNWDHSNIGKNEILEFSEKVKVTKAQKGFFIAKSFGKYGIAQSRKDKRIELIFAKDHKIDVTPFPASHLLYRDKNKKRLSLELVQKGSSASDKSKRVEETEEDMKKVRVNGNLIGFRDYFMTIADQMCEEKINQVATQFLDEGSYNYSVDKEIVYQKEESLKVNEIEIEKAILSVNFEIQIVKPKVKSNFEIERRGRFVDVEFSVPTGGKLNMLMTAVK